MKNLQKSDISQIRNWSRTFLGVQHSKAALIFVIGFPMGRDSATFWEKGTEVPSLTRDKKTTGQAQNLARPGRVGTA